MTDAAAQADWVFGAAVIRDKTGLHARPGGEADQAREVLRRGDRGARRRTRRDWVNAKSPNAVMKLAPGTRPRSRSARRGGTRAGAVAALTALVDANFDETPG